MFLYHPTESYIYADPIKYNVGCCFIISQLGKDVPQVTKNIRISLRRLLRPNGIKLIDATEEVTGRDFLFKIWRMLVSVPLGIAIITEECSHKTIGNIFYEIGMMQTLGKSTLVIKTPGVQIPSDFIRTEHIEYDHDNRKKFNSDIKKYLKSYDDYYEYLLKLGYQLESKPLISLDYFMRAYLIKPDMKVKNKMNDLVLANKVPDIIKDNVLSLIKKRS